MFERLLYAASLGFVGGVACASYVEVPLFYIGIGAFASAAVCLWLRLGTGDGRVVMFGAASILACCFGMVWMHAHAIFPDQWLVSHQNQRVGFVGTVIREPDERAYNTLLFVSDMSKGIDGLGGRVDGIVLVKAPLYPRFSYGDRVSVTGIVSLPQAFKTSEGRMFDYAAYLKRFGVTHSIDRSQVSLIEHGQGHIIVETLLQWKQKLLSSIAGVIPSPSSELLAGILFGSQRGLPPDVEDHFRRAGLVHIVVLSGYNLSVVADWIMRSVSHLPKTVGLSLGALSIIAYATMAGASATAVRAAIMALLVLIAQSLRRRYDVSRALIIAGLCMIILNPHILMFDRSFQLSFLATIAVIYVSPLFERRLQWVSNSFSLRGIVASTIATNIMVLPLLLYMSGSMSLFSLPANVLALPVVPATMFLGTLTALTGLFAPTVSLVMGLCTHMFLVWIIHVAQWFGGEWATLTLPPFSWWWVCGVYGALAIIIVRTHRKNRLVSN